MKMYQEYKIKIIKINIIEIMWQVDLSYCCVKMQW